MGHPEIFFQRLRISIAPGPFYHQERSTLFSGPIWILETARFSLNCVILANIPSDLEGC